jgi:hypothetical protein
MLSSQTHPQREVPAFTEGAGRRPPVGNYEAEQPSQEAISSEELNLCRSGARKILTSF